jgi:N-acetyl-anhydromuramyl-L-alanine amidase AmpD
MPEITGRTYRPVVQPPTVKPPVPTAAYTFPWQPAANVEKRWTAIIIHHSATDAGNMALFHHQHKVENGWDGIGYDFVIGNGTNSGNGQIEQTYRWTEQRTGAHCGGTANNWANVDGIGICLVGNFNETQPTPQQMNSLLKLVKFLQSRYNIPKNRVFGHGTTPGARVTDCPGTRFPMAKFKAMLDF